MLRVKNVKLSPKDDKKIILDKICKKHSIDKGLIKSYKIVKESLDARNKGNIFFIYTVDIEVENEDKLLKKIKSNDIIKVNSFKYSLPEGEISGKIQPVIIGFGPAGIFAALTLCQLGFKPIVLERGESVENRVKTVDNFWKNGVLNTNSNVQFGEGGAGTFSDGKLTSRSKDLRSEKVFSEFILAGAPKEIEYAYNPHIGTDLLREVVKKLREKIIELGGEIRFNSHVTNIKIENEKVIGVEINNEEFLSCEDVVLAIGHSARDTFEMIYNNNVKINPKPFAMGVRIEHLQKDINAAQFGDFKDEEALGAAEYKLTHTCKNGRGVYTFCMCPGGHVVGAASEEGMVCVNGMSYHARDGENANSALLVQIGVEDLDEKNPLSGMEFQRELEKKAFILGGSTYSAPAQKLGDFMGENSSNMTVEKNVKTTYKPSVKYANLNDLFPEFMLESMKEAIVAMGNRIKGFDDENSVLTGVESRSSSPIRIERDRESCQSVNISGLYPTGEGAGYAGGIVSAAIDGVTIGEKLFEKYRAK